MKIKNVKWILGLCFCFCQCLSGYAQLLLIQQENPSRKVILPKGKYVKIKHGAQYTTGYLDIKGKDFINILPERNSDVPLFDLTKEEPLMGYQIPIARIESISTPKKFSKKVMTVVGSALVVVGALYTIGGISAKKQRPDLSKPWAGTGLLSLGIGIPLILGSRQKKYRINQNEWLIN